MSIVFGREAGANASGAMLAALVGSSKILNAAGVTGSSHMKVARSLQRSEENMAEFWMVVSDGVVNLKCEMNQEQWASIWTSIQAIAQLYNKNLLGENEGGLVGISDPSAIAKHARGLLGNTAGDGVLSAIVAGVPLEDLDLD